MNTILVAVDFSERSDRALRRAVLLARQSGARLRLVHVIDDDQTGALVEAESGIARGLLAEQAATLRQVDGVDAEARVVLASPFAGIVEAARSEAPDLLVIGPHRRRVLRDVFLGTTAERTIRSVGCPVLMVNAPPVAAYRHVLLATDLSETAERTTQHFLALGLAKEARHAMLHVFDVAALRLATGRIPADEKEQLVKTERDAALLELARFAASANAQDMEQIVLPDRAGVAREILAASASIDADLIVVGTSGRSGLGKLVLGSTAEAVLRHADRDVLAVPAPRTS